MTLGSRLKNAWNVFFNKNPTETYIDYGMGYGARPDRARMTRGNEKTIISAVYNRIAMDVAEMTVKHAKKDENGRYIGDVDSELNRCLTLEANIDQTSRAFLQDAVISMLDEGCVAIIPIHTTASTLEEGAFDVLSMRTGKVLAWYPQHVRVRAYDERFGRQDEVTLPKRNVAIVENPLYAVINEPNSVMKRLQRKLSLLDAVDEQASAGKLDLIIQLPYVIKTEARRQQADIRKRDLEAQLAGSKYGIAYTDGTEKVTQLNRPVENNLMKQVEYLTSMLYSQLGITQAILDGSADEKAMLNYYDRTVEPILSAITDEMNRKFLTQKARTQGKAIMFFRDPFRLAPVNDLAAIAETFTRNEIMSSNEVRQIIGMKPSDDPKADELRNKNLNANAGTLARGEAAGVDNAAAAPPLGKEPVETLTAG